MKKIVTMLATVCLFSLSCRKAVDTPPVAEALNLRSTSSESSPIEKKFIVNGQEIVLRMILAPAVVCYSYSRGEAPKPCDIFIDFTCTLSQPVNGHVMVQVQKKNITESSDVQPVGLQNDGRVVFNIAPNSTKFTFRSSFRNNNNMMVDENRFGIEKVSFYRFTN